jgi:uncharacterized oxidoreductase
MNLQQPHVLITGGSEGIGFGLASRFIQAGNDVLIIGRNRDNLKKASAIFPRLRTFVNDIGILCH